MHANIESNRDNALKYKLKTYLLIFPLCFPGGYLHGSSHFAVKKGLVLLPALSPPL